MGRGALSRPGARRPHREGPVTLQPTRAALAAPSRPSRLVADVTLLLITMTWGFTFVAVKDAVAQIPVFSFLALRFGLAALTLGGTLAVTGREGLDGLRPALLPGLGTGLLLFAGYALQTLGLQYTTPGKAGFITGLSVALVPVLDRLLYGRRQPGAALMGVALAVMGMAVMFVEPAEISVRRGDWLVLGCALAFGAHVTVVAHAGRLPMLPYTLWQVVAVALVSGLAATLDGWGLEGMDLGVAGTLLLTGPVVSGLLLVLQVWAQRHTPATHAALIFATEPIFAALSGALLAGERLGPRVLAGGLAILVGTVWAEVAQTGPGAARRVAPRPGEGRP